MNIGIFYNHPKNYKGGFNYIVNFILCMLHQNTRFKIYLFCNKYHYKLFNKKIKNNNLKIIPTLLLDRDSILFYLHKLFEKFFNSFLFFDLFIKKFKLDLVSHSYYYGTTDFVHWLPDLQFLHFPQNFPKKKEKYINQTIKIYEKAKKIILSSYDCKNDLSQILTNKKKIDEKVLIYRFPVSLSIENQKDLNEIKIFLRDKNIAQQEYYFVANQFWEHKNYEFLFEVFKILNSYENKKYKLICTGSMIDNRGVEVNYLNKFKEELKNETIIILGQVNYKLVQGLIFFSKAYINPSKFEGWNTGVEEAKMMKKYLLLSDLKIHREQCENYKDVSFFDYQNKMNLVNLIKRMNKKTKDNLDLNKVIENNNKYFHKVSLCLQRKYLSIKDTLLT